MNFRRQTVAAAALVFSATLALADSGTTNSPMMATNTQLQTNAATSAATGFIEKFEVPERDEDGNLKWKLSGDRALLRPDGLMDILNARAEFYSSNKVDMVFTSPVCVLDRANNRAATDAAVRIERDNMIVLGIGGDWDGKTSSLVVRSNVQVILKNGSEITGLEPRAQ